MPAQQAAALAEFARTCKAAVRSVSLYPPTHPAIGASLMRVVAATKRLTNGGDITLMVNPDLLTIDGRTPVRPDPAIGELAALLHEHLVGSLRIEHAVELEDWHALLPLLARTPEDLRAEGGIAQGWALTGRLHFEIREIDYAEVLRERAGAKGAEWDQIVAYCLRGDAPALDERSLAALLDTLGDPDRFGELLERFQTSPAGGDASIGARAGALLALIRTLTRELSERQQDPGLLLQTVADAAARLTPDMMLALISQARSASAEQSGLASSIITRMSDNTVASFVAASVATDHGATERLAQAFGSLVPEAERREHLLELARADAASGPLGQEQGFDGLWQNASQMLQSYADETFVSAEYARELSDAKSQAIEVERVSDDPPERIQGWLSTVSDTAVQDLDLKLLVDLLRIESDPAKWEALATAVVTETQRRTLLGEIENAQRLIDNIVAELGAQGRDQLRGPAEAAIERLAGGALVRHIVVHLRKVDEWEVAPLNTLSHAIGPRIVRPLAEALAVEDNARAIRRLRELLLGFGAAGRQSVEQLKNSPNPAVRRTAIDLLRVFGGRDALPELASMLDDADAQVQRESIRAIVQIGTNEAYAVLQRVLVAGSASRDTVVHELIALRDDKAAPLLCYVLNHSAPRGKLVQIYADIIDALGGLNAHPESTRTLRTVLYRGDWWAPLRTAALRSAAAKALRRIGSPEAITILEEAGRRGSHGVRSAVRRTGVMRRQGSPT
jgi:hypothetical protein